MSLKNRELVFPSKSDEQPTCGTLHSFDDPWDDCMVFGELDRRLSQKVDGTTSERTGCS